MNTYELNSEFNHVVFTYLEKFHGIFYALTDMGFPHFTDSIPTACVEFDKIGQNIAFKFNPDFWKEMSDYKKAFVICHESLHVILDHGSRAIDCKNQRLCNVAMDIVVNHMLVDKFNLDRNSIEGQENLCWIDTIFKEPDKVEADQNFEYYYGLLMDPKTKLTIDRVVYKKGLGDMLDDHEGLKKIPSEELAKEIRKAMDGRLPKGEIEDFLKKMPTGMIGQVGEPPAIGEMVHFCKKKPPIKKKWESIIKKWTAKKYEEKEEEQWLHESRRMVSMPRGDCMLPHDYDVESPIFDKIEVFFFLDCSGSCWHLKDRFFEAARTLNPKKFNVRLFSRTTVVRETSLESGKMYGGDGSDDFGCMERFIQKEIKTGKIKKYPDAVFHITDGGDCSGELMVPQVPKNWHWFLAGSTMKTWIADGCNIYNLKDFE